MLDHATELRRLVRENATAFANRGCACARVVAVTGGKGGVGTTTIAVNLAVVLAQGGWRTVLADLSPSGRDAVALCGLDLQGVKTRRRAGESHLADLLAPGPGGLRVLVGASSRDMSWSTPETEDHLIEDLASLGPTVDFVVVDAGNNPSRDTRRLWRTADAIVVVATPELTSVMNAYAAVKSLASREVPPEVFSVVSRAPMAAVAEDIHARLAQACHRFLGIRLRFAGYVPPAIEIEEAGRRGQPFVLASPNSLACRQILAVSRGIVGSET